MLKKRVVSKITLFYWKKFQVLVYIIMVSLSLGVNTIDLTLSERSTLPNPVYVFLFESDLTKERFFCTNSFTELDGGIQRFGITVKPNPVWTSGEVELSKYGFYHYYVYECETIAGINYNDLLTADIRTLAPDYFTSLVEIGKMHYDAPTPVINSFKDTTQPVKAYGE